MYVHNLVGKIQTKILVFCYHIKHKDWTPQEESDIETLLKKEIFSWQYVSTLKIRAVLT